MIQFQEQNNMIFMRKLGALILLSTLLTFCTINEENQIQNKAKEKDQKVGDYTVHAVGERVSMKQIFYMNKRDKTVLIDSVEGNIDPISKKGYYFR